MVTSFWMLPSGPTIISLASNASSFIIAEWTSVVGADCYILKVKSKASSHTWTFYDTKGIATNLRPATIYNVVVSAANSAGVGNPSRMKQVVTSKLY
uniref:Fibronectin type-III domain-containing protein n=1 Tax=Callorhinchus milii TaxID=7868 RepID=A0A4W3I0C5_CALMI